MIRSHQNQITWCSAAAENPPRSNRYSYSSGYFVGKDGLTMTGHGRQERRLVVPPNPKSPIPPLPTPDPLSSPPETFPHNETISVLALDSRRLGFSRNLPVQNTRSRSRHQPSCSSFSQAISTPRLPESAGTRTSISFLPEPSTGMIASRTRTNSDGRPCSCTLVPVARPPTCLHYEATG